MTRSTRVGRIAGVLSPVALLSTVLGGALAAPSYEWPTEPFSVVGTTGGATALVFNAGLVISGSLGAVYGVHRWRTGRRGTGGVYVVGCLALAVAGVFPADTALHEVAAVFLFTAWLPPVADGVALWRTGDRAVGATGVLLGVAAVGIWLPYDVGPTWAQVGYGAAELVAFSAWGAWTAWDAVRPGTPHVDDGNAAVSRS